MLRKFSKPVYSIVVPVFNEEESIKELNQKISSSFSKIKKTYEIIFVDDGSTDKSLDILKHIQKKASNIFVYSFRRNLGKSNALRYGFQKASGKYIVTMDADLQDDPASISMLETKLVKNKLDMVTGWRRVRRDNLYKRFTSKVFNNIVSYLFGMKIHDLNSGLKIYRSEVAKELSIYGGMHRFIPVLVNEMGYRVGELEIIHHPRKYGKSKYKASKVVTDIPDLLTIYFLTKYTRRPLHFFGKIGTVTFGIGILFLVYLTALHFSGQRIGTRPLLLISFLLILTGIQTIFTGLLADFIAHSGVQKEEVHLPIKYASER